MKDLYDVAVRLIEQKHMFDCGDTVIAACSGGADSVALLHLLCRLKKEGALQSVVVAHVHHGLRGEQAEQDAAFVEKTAQRWQCPYEELRLNIRELAAQEKIGLEEAGRRARYSFFEQLTKKYPRAKIATAHTRSDVAETMLFRLARGTGSAGICGIPAVRGRIFRPLLNCTRKQVIEYLQNNGLDHREDESNVDLSFARNRIRHTVIPQLQRINPQCETALARTAEQMQQLEKYMCTQAETLAHRCCAVSGKDVFVRDMLLQEAEIVRTYLWRRCLIRMSVVPESRWIKAAEGLLQQGGKISLPNGKSIVADQKHICFISASAGLLKPVERCDAQIGELQQFALYEIGLYDFEKERTFSNVHNLLENFCVDRDKIKGKLFFRSRLPGDVFDLAGRGVCKTLKKLFNERKIPPEERSAIPLLCDECGIVYIPGIGYAQRVRVSAETEHVLWGCSKRRNADDQE